jgi:acyl-CoA-binding protein
VDRIERIAAALRSLDLGAGVTIEGRTFVGPADALARLGELEGIAAGLASRDLFALYDKRVGHDGLFDEDIHGSGRYYAYLLYELKGITPEDREAALVAALEELVAKYGKDSVLKYVPARIAGRQVTESLTVRPEPDDYPSYYSKARMAYAEKMAAEELPKAVLAGIRAEQERLLDSFGWTTVRVLESSGEPVDVCGDVYVLSPSGKEAVEPYRSIWSALVSGGPESFYDVEIALDGEYPADKENSFGRYYAYVKASLKGLSQEERRARLLASLPQAAVEAIGPDAAWALFRETMDGDQVTASLTIRPEADEYPSYFNAKKAESGRERSKKQILINTQAEVIAAVERLLGGAKKYIILD